MVKRQIERESTLQVFYPHWSSEKRIFSFLRELTQAFQRHPSVRLHPHWDACALDVCIWWAEVEKSRSELEESRLSIRFCLEIEKNWVKFKGKRRTAEGWTICKNNLPRFDNRQWQCCHNNRDSHLNLEFVEKFSLQSMLHWTLARIS